MVSVITVRDDLGKMPAEFSTVEEAIAEAMRQLDGNGAVVLHDVDCKHDGKSDNTCTCQPLELSLGARS